MTDFEKLGVFYLGREYDLNTASTRDELILYDAKDMTTHAVCVGMTGSGKTGLCLSLLEEAAIDGIPAICIDPKGDLGNLLLAFPELRPADFKPWLEQADATRKGLSLDQLAEKTAKTWKEGLAAWGQDAARIQRYRDAVDISIYTPGSTAGLPLTVLKSFAAPGPAVMRNPEALRDRVAGAASGLLALMGIDSDPLSSREHILLANLFDRSWKEGRSLDLAGLIREIQSPPLTKIGFLDLESFFPSKERFAFAMRLNNLIAAPGFQAWLEGEPLDIQRLLYTDEGKPRLTILSIAHLSDSERMFFVTLLLNEMISWMRAQSGTSSLRAMLYMDEVFGYFPPSANPPSKTPMLTLLKQARAFGLGVMLATQNPVDLDYKGLSNCGTWFLGRLQTERDKARVLDGLEGASTTAGAQFDRARMERILSGLGNRIFLMNNVHDDGPVVFQTRWALSFLRGPLTREQVNVLMSERREQIRATGAASPVLAMFDGSTSDGHSRPVLPPGILESFLPVRSPLPRGAALVYLPKLLGQAQLFYANGPLKLEHAEKVSVVAEWNEGTSRKDVWFEAEVVDDLPDVEKSPDTDAAFAPLPQELTVPKLFDGLASELKSVLYQNRALTIFKCPATKDASEPGESESDFRSRIGHRIREERDLRLEKLRQKYSPKVAVIQERIRKCEAKVEKEKSQASAQSWDSMLSIGATVMGAVLGRKLGSVSNVGRAASTMKTYSRASQAKQDVTAAEDDLESLNQQLAAVNAEFEREAAEVEGSIHADAIELESMAIRPKKTDITVTRVAILWAPHARATDGSMEPLS